MSQSPHLSLNSVPSKSRLFVASSREALDVAYALQENLEQDAEVTVWTQDVFQLSGTAVDDLLVRLSETDFAVFVYAPDDEVRMRGAEQRAVRDNIVFEHGLFLGKLGRQRTFVLMPQDTADLHIPSDLAGITPAKYDTNRSDKNLTAAVGPACHQIRKAIRRSGPFVRVAQLIVPEQRGELVLRGVARTRDAVARAFGPRGAIIEVTTALNGKQTTRDGTLIARGTHADSALEERGCQEMSELAAAMQSARGDGTKLAVLLAHSLAVTGTQYVAQGLQAHDVVRGIWTAVDDATQLIREGSRVAMGRRDIENVSRTAASSPIAMLVCNAMEAVGKDGVISVDEGSAADTELVIGEGTKFDRGFVSSEFVTDPIANYCELENCLILITAMHVQHGSDVLSIMEIAVRTERPLLLIADEVSGDALTFLIINFKANVLRSCAVRAPAHGDHRKDVLGDLAVLTGAHIISAELGRSLESVTLEDFGTAARVVIENDSTTILDGGGDTKILRERVGALRTRAGTVASEFEKERLQQRIANLQGCAATIRVGGLMPAEVSETKYRTANALHSATAAVEGGVVVGGGISLLRAASALGKTAYPHPGEDAGRSAVIRALSQPVAVLIQSSRADATDVMRRIETEEVDCGWDTATSTVTDLRAAGVLDATEVVVHALHLARSHARTLLLTEVWESSQPTSVLQLGGTL